MSWMISPGNCGRTQGPWDSSFWGQDKAAAAAQLLPQSKHQMWGWGSVTRTLYPHVNHSTTPQQYELQITDLLPPHPPRPLKTLAAPALSPPLHRLLQHLHQSDPYLTRVFAARLGLRLRAAAAAAFALGSAHNDGVPIAGDS